jgi:hypothetical protein
MIDYNVGDIVLCKKDFKISELKSFPITLYFKNRHYIITYSGYWDDDNNIIVYIVEDFEKSISTTFYIDKYNRLSINMREFENYFYTKTEHRLKKLNFINKLD